MFQIYDDKGKVVRKRVSMDFSNEKQLTEQSHKAEVDINNIIRKNAGNAELIAKTAALTKFVYDDVTTNNFEEMMNQMINARDTFASVPSHIRKQFGNDPAVFMDFVYNPDNKDKLVEMGLANPPEPAQEPVKVAVVSQPEVTTETPTEA